MAPLSAALRSAARTAARRVANAAPASGAPSAPRASFSTSHNIEHEKKHMVTWYYVSIAASPLALGYALYCIAQPHEHGEGHPEYPYLRIRAKDFPWGPESLFDTFAGKKAH